MFNMKTVSERCTHFITVKITSKFRMTARLSGTDLALRPLLCSKSPVISRFLKYKLCPPPFVSRVLISWQLVDPYLHTVYPVTPNAGMFYQRGYKQSQNIRREKM